MESGYFWMRPATMPEMLSLGGRQDTYKDANKIDQMGLEIFNSLGKIRVILRTIPR